MKNFLDYWFVPIRFSFSTAQVKQVSIVSVFRILDTLREEVFMPHAQKRNWE